MDDSRFDALVKSLSAASRRRVVGVAGSAVLGALFAQAGLDEALAKKKKKKGKKKKKKGCQGQLCGDTCISTRACCTSSQQGTWIAEGATVGQCGLCLGGNVTKDPVDCNLIDPDGCTICSDSFACVPAPDGTLCEGCGTCSDGFCEDADESRQCGNSCCSGATPFCVNEETGQCCPEKRACPGECCAADSGNGSQDGEICTRDGCCLEVKAANNCRADDPSPICTEKICCDQVWTQEGTGLACTAPADSPPGTRDYCCGPGRKCCFTGCCPNDFSCCGDEGGRLCCPAGQGCGGEGCIAAVPDHV